MSGHSKKPRILCLSRSTSQLSAILSHFAEEEFETVSASSPEEAVAFCAASHVSAIVLDSEFVTESGWTVTQSFRMVAPQLPIVLLGGNHGNQIPVGVDAVALDASHISGLLKVLLEKTPIDTNPASTAHENGLSLMRKSNTDSAANDSPKKEDGRPRGD